MINIPFSTEFQGLEDKEKNLFKEEVESRIKSFALSSEIISILKLQFVNHWDNGINSNLYMEDWTTFLKGVLNFDKFFNRIRKFIEQSDKYNTSSMDLPMPDEISPPTFFKAINALMVIFECAL